MRNLLNIAVVLLLTLPFSACNNECENFSEVQETLTPGLRQQLGGLLTNHTWVLANDAGDTVIINAITPFEEEILIEQDGRGKDCDRVYKGCRSFEYTRRGKFDRNFNFEDCFIASDLDFFRLASVLRWNIAKDTFAETPEVTYYDSLRLGDRVFTDVYIPGGDTNTEGIFIYNSKHGFVAIPEPRGIVYLKEVY